MKFIQQTQSQKDLPNVAQVGTKGMQKSSSENNGNNLRALKKKPSIKKIKIVEKKVPNDDMPSELLFTTLGNIQKKFQVFLDILVKFERLYNLNYHNTKLGKDTKGTYKEMLGDLEMKFNSGFLKFTEDILMEGYVESLWDINNPLKFNCKKKCCSDDRNAYKGICEERIKKMNYFNDYYQLILEAKEANGLSDWDYEGRFASSGSGGYESCPGREKEFDVQHSFFEKTHKDDVLEAIGQFSRADDSTANVDNLLSPRCLGSDNKSTSFLHMKVSDINNSAAGNNLDASHVISRITAELENSCNGDKKTKGNQDVKSGMMIKKVSSKSLMQSSANSKRRIYSGEYERIILKSAKNEDAGDSIRRKLDLDMIIEDQLLTTETSMYGNFQKTKLLEGEYHSTNQLILEGDRLRKEALNQSRKFQKGDKSETEKENLGPSNHNSFEKGKPRLVLNLLEEMALNDTQETEDIENYVNNCETKELEREPFRPTNIAYDNYHTFSKIQERKDNRQEFTFDNKGKMTPFEYTDEKSAPEDPNMTLKYVEDSHLTFNKYFPKNEKGSKSFLINPGVEFQEGLRDVNQKLEFEEMTGIKCKTLRKKKIKMRVMPMDNGLRDDMRPNGQFIEATERQVHTTWRRLDGIKQTYKEKSPVRIIKGVLNTQLVQNLFEGSNGKTNYNFTKKPRYVNNNRSDAQQHPSRFMV